MEVIQEENVDPLQAMLFQIFFMIPALVNYPLIPIAMLRNMLNLSHIGSITL